jgi:hypothetical protein
MGNFQEHGVFDCWLDAQRRYHVPNSLPIILDPDRVSDIFGETSVYHADMKATGLVY